MSGLNSPLLNALNVRYIVVPAVVASDQLAPRFDQPLATVYADDDIRILENPSALPRAWLVHAAQQVLPARRQGCWAVLISAGRFCSRSRHRPSRCPYDPALDAVQVERYDADRISLRVASTAPGLLVLSEVYYPAWQAYVDGQPARVLVADHALRAVPVPAGAHTVELRYESLTLAIGLAVSLAAILALLGLALTPDP